MGLEWHAQREVCVSTMREGKPIIRSDEAEVCTLVCVTGGVVKERSRSRKCCSLRATP